MRKALKLHRKTINRCFFRSLNNIIHYHTFNTIAMFDPNAIQRERDMHEIYSMRCFLSRVLRLSLSLNRMMQMLNELINVCVRNISFNFFFFSSSLSLDRFVCFDFEFMCVRFLCSLFACQNWKIEWHRFGISIPWPMAVFCAIHDFIHELWFTIFVNESFRLCVCVHTFKFIAFSSIGILFAATMSDNVFDDR